MTTVNPNFINVTDAGVGITAFKISVGVAAGGPYTTSSATVPVGSFTDTGGNFQAPFSAAVFSPALSNSTVYFAVCEAETAGGLSGNSPEASFQIVSAPPVPTAFSFT